MSINNGHRSATANPLEKGTRLDSSSQDETFGEQSPLGTLNRFDNNSFVPSAPARRSEGGAENWSLALQNVLDRPPASFPYKVMLGSALFCAAFAAWAWLGQVEEIGHARGQLVPKGEVYKVNPVESGKIATVGVKEGDTVKAGQVLMELDTQLARGEVDRLEQLLASYKVEFAQKQTLLEKARLEAATRDAIASSEQRAQTAAIASAQQKVATAEKMLLQLQTEVEAYQARKQRLEPLTAQTQELLAQQQAAAAAAIERVKRLEPSVGKTQELLSQLQGNLDAAKERVERLKPLVQEGAISKELLFQAEQAVRDANSAIAQTQLQQVTNTNEQIFQAEQSARDATRAMTQIQLQEIANAKEQLFQAEQALRDRASSITQTQGELSAAQSEVDRLVAELNRKQAEARRTALESQQLLQQLEVDLTQLKAKIADTQNLLDTAKAKLKERFIYAPVAGAISSLNVSKIGEVVQSGQTIAEISPQGAPLVLKALLPNREAGFVKTGMPVKIKFDAYPYQDYGIISGTVTSISPDAKPDANLGAVYKIEVKLEQNYVKERHQTILFKAGQTATADIIIRRRRLADVFLEPIKQLQGSGIDL